MSDYISREAAKLAVVDVAQSRENGFQWGEEVTFTPSKIIGLIDKIPAAEVQPVRWIPVEEQLPEEYRSVLVCFMSQGGMAQSVSERFDDNRWSALCGFAPVAWMPLPEPPKQEEG